MVKIRYKGTGITFARTAGGLVHTFKPNMVYEFDETHKRFAPFVEKLLKNPAFEVQTEVGQKTGGGGLKTHIRPPKRLGRPDKSREHLGKSEQATKKEVKCPKGSYKCKGVCKCKGLKKPKGLRKPKRAD